MSAARSHEQPAVLIVGGFMTVPPNYWPMRGRLLARGAARVDIAPLWPPDWMIGGVLGFGPLLRRTGKAVAATYRAGGGRPIIVIGHSGGGLVVRLAMSTEPFNGRIAKVAEAVGCLVTLGTPHGLAQLTNRYRHAGHEAAAFLDRTAPGAHFAPRTSYLTVGSSYEGATFPGLAGRLATEVFSMVVGSDSATAAGDGIVPSGAAHLPGARQLTFDDARHGHIGSNWYGADEMIDRWWPTALELWHEALRARSVARS
jgi:pimeloyl-ACP methyl ester carboxylesterase